MPDGFKKIGVGTDAPDMPDSAVNDDSLGTFLLDGELPRLGEPPKPVAPVVSLSVAADMSSFAPPPPGSAPLLMAAEPTLPTPTLASPVLPGSVQMPDAMPAADGDEAEPAAPAHPMAHLMPGKVQPSESSIRAAQLRAEKKAKARKKSILALVVLLAIGAVVGPPLARWLVAAINEAGSTKTDDTPATTVATDPDETTDTTDATTPADGSAAESAADDAADDPGDDAEAPTLAELAGLPGEAQDVVDATNDQPVPTVRVGSTLAPLP